MFLRHLELEHFRNYTELSLAFHRSLNIFFGKNAQGKTNLLEAILFLALVRSPRTGRDAELVQWHQPWARVYGVVQRHARHEVKVEILLYPRGRKVVRVNGVHRRRLAEVLGEVSVVLFSPQDVEMAQGEPSLRRRFLNMALCQTSAEYYLALNHYRRVLEQRNEVLRRAQAPGFQRDWLLPWNEQLIHYASVLIHHRLQAVESLSLWARETHAHLSGGQEVLEVHYQPSVPLDGASTLEEIRHSLRSAMERLQEEELRRGNTLVGPHRDHLLLRVNGIELRTFGSQGQQRTAALSLKLAELRWLEQNLGETPLLLLDDVMSELDEERRRRVMDLTQNVEQIFITCAQERTFSEAILRNAGVFRIEEGSVTEVQNEIPTGVGG